MTLLVEQLAAVEPGLALCLRDIRSGEPARGVERIYVPGEIEHLRRAERLADGIPLDDALVTELESLGMPLGLGSLVSA